MRFSLKFMFPVLAILFLAGGPAVSAQEASANTSQESEATAGQIRTIHVARAEVQEGDEGEEGKGQIIVVDANGKRHVFRIATEGGASVLVEPKAVAGKDGTLNIETRAILVGPDGKREVVDLDEAEGVGGTMTWSLAQPVEGDVALATPQFRFLRSGKADGAATARVLTQMVQAAAGDYMIGVSCDTVSDALKAQLGVESGLLVTEVFDGSPASGTIEAHDILVAVNDEPLSEVEQLIEAIQAAGKDGAELRIKLIRKGESESVKVTPTKREGNAMQGEVSEAEVIELDGIKGITGMSAGITLESVGPGVVWKGKGGRVESVEGVDADLKAQIEELQRQVEALRKEIGDR